MRRFAAVVAVVLAAAGIGIVASYRSALERAEQRVAQGSAIASTPCGTIEYAVTGTGPTILLVHGAGGGFDQGIDIGEALARQGFRVVAMSRFGYLRTPLPADASPAAQADAHACLLDALRIDRAAVIGASAGAPSALQLVLRHPTRTSALVLVVPATYMPRPGGTLAMRAPASTQFFFDTALRSDFLFWVATRIARRTLSHAILATPSAVIDGASPEERARANAILDRILPVSARRLGLVNDAAVTTNLPRYPLERIALPTLVISSEDDLFGTFEAGRYTAEQIPGAKFIGFHEGGHVWVGHHAELLSRISAFLRPSNEAQ